MTDTARGENLGLAQSPCAACPWLTANQGRRTPDGWYTKANLKRLWSGLRTGDAPGMTCHPTDPDNPAPTGRPNAQAPEGSDFHECAGAHTLLQRELRLFETACEQSEQDGSDAWRNYRAASGSLPMTREGMAEYVSRITFAGTALDPRPTVTQMDLSAPVSKP